MIEVHLLAAVTKTAQKVLEATPSVTSKTADANSAVAPTLQKVSTASAILADFINSLPFYILNLFFFAYFLLIWVLMVRFVGRDCEQRGITGVKKKNYQVMVLLFNFPGLLLYLMMRPSNTLKDIKRVEMEEEILTLELEKLRRETTSQSTEEISKQTNTFLG